MLKKLPWWCPHFLSQVKFYGKVIKVKPFWLVSRGRMLFNFGTHSSQKCLCEWGFKSGSYMSRNHSYTSTLTAPCVFLQCQVCYSYRSLWVTLRSKKIIIKWVFYLTHDAPWDHPNPLLFCLFEMIKGQKNRRVFCWKTGMFFLFLILLSFSFYSHCQTKQPPLLRPVTTRSKARSHVSLARNVGLQNR